jgi:hypothetical protein
LIQPTSKCGVARSREATLEFLHSSLVEEIMFVRACGGLCLKLGAATPLKWNQSPEALFDELSKVLVQRPAVEKRIGLLVHTCNLARLIVQKDGVS